MRLQRARRSLPQVVPFNSKHILVRFGGGARLRAGLESCWYVGNFETDFGWAPICVGWIIADAYRRARGVPKSHSTETMVLAGRPNHDDNHGEGRRCGIRVGKGMVSGAEICYSDPQRGLGYDAEAGTNSSDSGGGPPLVLVSRKAIPGGLPPKRRQERLVFDTDRMADLQNLWKKATFSEKIRSRYRRMPRA